MTRQSSVLEWRRSSYSPPGEGVEWCATPDVVRIRDGKSPVGPTLSFTASEWQAFLGGIRAGAFDTHDFAELPHQDSGQIAARAGNPPSMSSTFRGQEQARIHSAAEGQPNTVSESLSLHTEPVLSSHSATSVKESPGDLCNQALLILMTATDTLPEAYRARYTLDFYEEMYEHVSSGASETAQIALAQELVRSATEIRDIFWHANIR